MKVLNNSSHKYVSKIVGLVVALGLSNQAFAATETGTLTVTANVQPTCFIGDSTLAFGEYKPVTDHATAALDGSTTVSVTCTKDTVAKVYSSTDLIDRSMSNGGTGTLNYKLYTDSGRGTELGTSDAANTIPVTGTGAAQNIDLFGRIPFGQNVPSGNYTGTANLTISY